MKTEHEKLKWICDTIGCNEHNFDGGKFLVDLGSYGSIEIGVREIIFTPKFLRLIRPRVTVNDFYNLLDNTGNPVEYIYNLLKGKTTATT